MFVEPFSTVNAVQSGDPGYTVAAAPPYWGTQFFAMHMETKCTEDKLDMLTMKPGDKFTCNTIFRFPATLPGSYALQMGTYDSFYPGTRDATCTGFLQRGKQRRLHRLVYRSDPRRQSRRQHPPWSDPRSPDVRPFRPVHQQRRLLPNVPHLSYLPMKRRDLEVSAASRPLSLPARCRFVVISVKGIF